MSLYTMKLSDSVDTMEFNLLEVPIQDKDIEGAVDNVVLSGDIYTDFLWLKKRFTHKWSILCKDDYERLRGFYTRQFSNAEVPIYQLLDAPSPVEESAGSGEYIQITTTDSTAKLASVEMLGNAEQTTYSGKNLCSRGYYESTATARFEVNKSTLQQTFTISYISDVTAGNATIYLFTDGTNRGSVGVTIQQTAGTRRSATITLDATNWGYVQNATAVRFTAYLGNAGHTTDATITQAMVENGSSMTDYEPYVGGTSAPNPEFPQPISVVAGENIVKIEGKNLCYRANLRDAQDIEFYFSGLRSRTFTLAFTTNETLNSNSIYLRSVGNIQWHNWGTVGTVSGSSGTRASCTITLTEQIYSELQDVIKAGGVPLLMLYKGGANFQAPNDAQLELGSTATAYEPYQGQEFEVNLGKNMIDPTTMENGYVLDSGGVQPVASTGDMHTPFVKVEPSTEYTFEIFETTQTHADWIGYCEYTGANEASYISPRKVKQGSKFYTFTTGSTTQYIRLSARNLQGATQYMLSQGEPTTYAPYFTPIELAKIGDYQDRIYKDDGKWYIEKQVGKLLLNGSENWTLVSTADNTARFKVQGLTSAIVINETSVLLMSNYFTCYPSNERTQDKIGMTTYINQDLYIRTDVNSISTVAALKTWLGTHNTIVYYALATPTTTEITNEALIAQLDALGASSLYLGVNNIGTETQNAVPTLALTYFPYYPHEIISPKAVRMELTDGGIINACECRENVQITLRETIQ